MTCAGMWGSTLITWYVILSISGGVVFIAENWDSDISGPVSEPNAFLINEWDSFTSTQHKYMYMYQKM